MKVKCLWPNLLTLLGLMTGLSALWFAYHEALGLSLALFVSAALIDRYDGKLARYLGCTTCIGAALDTFSDTVVFLIAAAVSTYFITSLPTGIAGGLLVLYVFMGVARLIRFHRLENRSFNVGLPVTAAGPILYGVNLTRFWFITQPLISTVLETIVILLVTVLMISTFKVKR